MARIIYSALVTAIRGSVGGTTFQQNQYGSTIKNKPKMIRPRSNQQEKRKIYMTAATQAWGNLTVNRRNAYNTYAYDRDWETY